MKIKKLEYGIELIPESKYEEECLSHISGKQVKVQFVDSWEQKGPLKIEFEPHPWDRR